VKATQELAVKINGSGRVFYQVNETITQRVRLWEN